MVTVAHLMSIDISEKSPKTAKKNGVYPFIDPFTRDSAYLHEIVSVFLFVRQSAHPSVGPSIIQSFRLARVVFEHFHYEITMLPEAEHLFTDSLTPTGEYKTNTEEYIRHDYFIVASLLLLLLLLLFFSLFLFLLLLVMVI